MNQLDTQRQGQRQRQRQLLTENGHHAGMYRVYDSVKSQSLRLESETDLLLPRNFACVWKYLCVCKYTCYAYEHVYVHVYADPNVYVCACMHMYSGFSER